MATLESSLDRTLQDRGSEYGPFIHQGKLTQNLKNVVRQHPHWENLEGDMQEGIDMIMHKIARIVNGNPRNTDSWHDIAGYAMCVEKRLISDSQNRRPVEEKEMERGPLAYPVDEKGNRMYPENTRRY